MPKNLRLSDIEARRHAESFERGLERQEIVKFLAFREENEQFRKSFRGFCSH